MNHSSEPSSEESLLRDVLVEAARASDPLAGQDAHLDADTFVAYHEGSLGDDDARRARDHLVACATCAGLLTDLSAGFENDHEDDASHTGTLDIEHAATWRALKAGLPEVRGTTPGSSPWTGTTARSSALPWALAAILLATVAGLVWRLNQLANDTEILRAQIAVLDAPQTEVAIAYLDAVTRDAEAESTVIVGPSRPLFLLILTPPLDEPERTYRIAVLDASGNPRWSSAPLIVNDHGTLRVALSRRFVPPGHYRVHLLDTEGTLIDERTLRVIDGA